MAFKCMCVCCSAVSLFNHQYRWVARVKILILHKANLIQRKMMNSAKDAVCGWTSKVSDKSAYLAYICIYIY